MMKSYWLLLASAATLLVSASPSHGGTKPSGEDLAVSAALNFAGAFNARSIEHLLWLSEIPFLAGSKPRADRYDGNPQPQMVRTREEFREMLGKVRTKLPTQIFRSFRYQGRPYYGHAMDLTMRKLLPSWNGYVVILRQRDERLWCPVLVRVTGSRPKVVGWLWTRTDDDPKAKELAKQVATTFAKAFNDRDVAGMRKVSSVPFLAGARPVMGSGIPPWPRVVGNWNLSEELGQIEGELPDEVVRVVKYENERGWASRKEAEFLDRALATNGYVVLLTYTMGRVTRVPRWNKSLHEYPVYVRVKNGRAEVVGWLWTRKGHINYFRK